LYKEAVIENRPGAGSTLGSRAAAGAEAHGYTLLFGSSGSIAVAPALYAKLNSTAIIPASSSSSRPYLFRFSDRPEALRALLVSRTGRRLAGTLMGHRA
jgi:tripartite-type tricarboxylate transporter receptor subunit TctC